MNNITTDYRESANADTLTPGAFTAYRFTHWLIDILKNFFADPINIKDERVQKLLLYTDDETSETTLNALFKVGTPYNPKDVKSGATPAIIVSAGGVQFPLQLIKNIQYSVNGTDTYSRTGTMMKPKSITASIEIVTESYDGTLLLSDLITDFLCINELNLVRDNGSITAFSVDSCSGVQPVQEDQADNAEILYQATIGVSAFGSVSWVTDTQGPVYRGTAQNVNVPEVGGDSTDLEKKYI